MTRTRLLTVLFAVTVLAGFASVASAHYDPSLGRWLERDPLGTINVAPRIGQGLGLRTHNADGMNLYAYVNNSPIVLTDFMGLAGEDPSAPISSGPPAVRDRLKKCLEGCDQWKQMPWYVRWFGVTGKDISDCRTKCYKNHLSTGFWSCNRNMDKRGADCGDSCIIGLADFLENHGFISYGLNLDFAFSLHGEELADEPPTSEKRFPGSAATCYRCYRKDSVLQHGSGQGKSAFGDATIDDIKDCIKNAKARKDYSAFGYNCNSWTKETLEACGLTCARDMSHATFDKAGPYGIPWEPPGRIE